MISSLRGTIAHKEPPQLVVEVAGVGYDVECPLSTWAVLPETGREVLLRTHLVIREDQHLLYGFATESERRVFRDLLRVNGVGPKIALAILSGMSVDGLVRCVQAQDVATLTTVPGVGRKTAERLLLDLKDRLADLGGAATAPTVAATGDARGSQREVLDALVNLGYRPIEARRMIDQAAQPEGTSTAELLRAALRTAAAARGQAAG